MTLFTSGLKFTCNKCVNGHRANECRHFNRVENRTDTSYVFLITDRGRPSKDAKVKPANLECNRIKLISARISSSNKRCPYDNSRYSYQCKKSCDHTKSIKLGPTSVKMLTPNGDIITPKDYHALPKSASDGTRTSTPEFSSGSGVRLNKGSSTIEKKDKTSQPKAVFRYQQKAKSLARAKEENLSHQLNLFNYSWSATDFVPTFKSNAGLDIDIFSTENYNSESQLEADLPEGFDILQNYNRSSLNILESSNDSLNILEQQDQTNFQYHGINSQQQLEETPNDDEGFGAYINLNVFNDSYDDTFDPNSYE